MAGWRQGQIKLPVSCCISGNGLLPMISVSEYCLRPFNAVYNILISKRKENKIFNV
jgi:hypothetical protein